MLLTPYIYGLFNTRPLHTVAEALPTIVLPQLIEKILTLRHMLPNALIPIITVIGMSFPLLITGAIITETVFAWSGMGALTMSAILSRDYPVLMGIIFVVGLGVLVLNLVIDVLYAVVDPRIRYS